MVNKVILIGNLGRDPEVHTAASNGHLIAQLSLATTRRVKMQDGSYENETEWHRVVCFGKTSEVARDYLAKGRQIYIEGQLRTRKYKDKQGIERWVTEVICDQLKMLGRKDDAAPAAAPAPAPRSSAQASTPTYDDEVPF